MKTLIHILFHRIAAALRDRWYLQLECLALRHQLEVLKRSAKRPRFDPADRCLWVLLSQWWPAWPQALEIMQADTVRRWRRQGLWCHVRWGRRRKRPGRPVIPAETRDLIRAMSHDNRLWGAPRIHGELAKLGITVSRTTVAKYMIRRPYPPSPTWRTFIRNQTPECFRAEVYAELSGRFRAVSTRLFRTLRQRLSLFVSGWRCQSRCHHAASFTERHDPLGVSVVLSWDSAAPVMASERSPPGSRLSAADRPFRTDSPTDVGRCAVRLNPSVVKGWGGAPLTQLVVTEGQQRARGKTRARVAA